MGQGNPAPNFLTETDMTYPTEFPDYASTIPDVFLKAPWTDASWHNDACPCFSRARGGEGGEVHVYVDEDKPSLREIWTARDGKQTPCPRYSVRFTDEEGHYTDDDSLDFFSDSLGEVLDRIGFVVGEISR